MKELAKVFRGQQIDFLISFFAVGISSESELLGLESLQQFEAKKVGNDKKDNYIDLKLPY